MRFGVVLFRLVCGLRAMVDTGRHVICRRLKVIMGNVWTPSRSSPPATRVPATAVLQ